MHTILYINENIAHMPQNAILLNETMFENTDILKQNNIFFWKGTLDTLVSALSKEDIKKGLLIFHILLREMIAQREQNQWQYYTCNAVLMYCCAGAYLKIVNKTKINFQKTIDI